MPIGNKIILKQVLRDECLPALARQAAYFSVADVRDWLRLRNLTCCCRIPTHPSDAVGTSDRRPATASAALDISAAAFSFVLIISAIVDSMEAIASDSRLISDVFFMLPFATTPRRISNWRLPFPRQTGK